MGSVHLERKEVKMITCNKCKTESEVPEEGDVTCPKCGHVWKLNKARTAILVELVAQSVQQISTVPKKEKI